MEPAYQAYRDTAAHGRGGGGGEPITAVYAEQIYTDPNQIGNVGTLVRINPKSHYEDPISVL